ncbi:ABC-2 type transport system permease protein [Amaricoccus macauensis]|uniref:ABC-2 type transport system permease protein n=1 Tax=Amaricoccus macauensis TaxID=57001 RepID=A0A840SRJ1_9RHOB|nr:ABC transporter permease [Amaricoccus macauensis]MBB5221832.1 ABC-2 type transport system permease protein [Amaricoccus macauensis]
MRLANVLNLGIKELRGLARDTAMLILIVYSFSIAVYMQSRSVPDALNRAALAIVDGDQSTLSTRITTAFYPPHFNPPVLIGEHEMDARLDMGLDTFALVIPPGFERDVAAGRMPEVQLNIDATRMTQAFTGGGYISSIVGSEVREYVDRYRSAPMPNADLALRARFNPALDQSWFGAITNVITSVTMLSIILTGAALIREREHGTIEHLLVMPVTPTEIMLSKVWSMALVVWVATAFSLLVVVQGLLGVPLGGSLTLFLAATALQLIATTCMGIFIATIAGAMPQFGLLMMLILMPLQILSGAMTPRESMPEVIQTIMLAAPNTHFVILAQAILFRGAGFAVVWPQFAALVVISAAYFFLALAQFRRFLR